MPLPNPPFPRRGIPSPKAPRLPGRREEQKPFFRTRQGYRLLFYAFLLLAFAGAMLGKLGQWQSRQGGAESRAGADSRSLPLTSPPRAFISSDVRHALITLEDFTSTPRPSAVATALQFLHRNEGTASQPSPLDFTDLEIDESVAHPEAFRGGLVRVRGLLLGIDTRGPEEALTYRGWLIVGGGRDPKMVTWETDVIPRFQINDTLDLTGVFLQAVTFETKGKPRTTPFVAGTLTLAARSEQASGFLDKLFTPIAIFLIILILATTLFLVTKSRRSAPATRYVARPPGPGR